MFALGMNNEQLAQIAATIGADCPFFIYNRPLLATGIGDIFSEVDIDLSQYSIVIAKPRSSVSTKEAYAGVTPHDNDLDIRQILMKYILEWKTALKNDFEDSLFPNHPEILAVKDTLYNAGALYASMTGSGAAVFGIFASKEAANNFICKDCIIYRQN